MSNQLTRRQFTKRALAAPALLQLGTHRAAAEDKSDPSDFFFVTAADPQLFWGPLALWQEAIRHVNRLKPAFMVVCGDLIQEPGNEDQARAYLNAAGALRPNIPLYNVAGNHDVLGTPTHKSLAWYEEHFGKPWYSFQFNDCLFLVLESNMLNRPDEVPDLANKQMAWLRRTLAEADTKRFRHKIVFKHYPLCLKQVDEKGQYFNVPQARRRELLDLFHKHHVAGVFSGHYHRNAYVRDGKLELVTTSSLGKALGADPPGFRIVRVFRDRLEHAYYPYEKMPAPVG